MQPIQDLTVDPRVARPSSIIHWSAPIWTILNDSRAQAGWPPEYSSRTQRCEQRPAGQGTASSRWRLIEVLPLAWESRHSLLMTPSTMRSDNVRYPTFLPNRINISRTRSEARVPAGPGAPAKNLFRSASGGTVPLSAITRATETTGPLLLVVRDSFPP